MKYNIIPYRNLNYATDIKLNSIVNKRRPPWIFRSYMELWFISFKLASCFFVASDEQKYEQFFKFKYKKIRLNRSAQTNKFLWSWPRDQKPVGQCVFCGANTNTQAEYNDDVPKLYTFWRMPCTRVKHNVHKNS